MSLSTIVNERSVSSFLKLWDLFFFGVFFCGLFKYLVVVQVAFLFKLIVFYTVLSL